MAFQKQTVFVIGAGAHVPMGMPTGPTLNGMMIEGRWPLDDTEVRKKAQCDGLRHTAHDTNPRYLQHFPPQVDFAPPGQETDFAHFSKELKGSSIESIDAFLDQREDLFYLGQWMVCAYLNIYERLAVENSTLGGSFYAKILDRYTPSDGWKAPGLFEYRKPMFRNLNLITFNYDRLAEILFTRMYGYRTGNRPTNAIDLSVCPKVHHVYGQLDTRFLKPERADLLLSTETTLEGVSRSTKTALLGINRRDGGEAMHVRHDGAGNTAMVKQSASGLLPDLLRNAEAIVFMGFGFDPYNLRNLGFNGKFQPTARILATSLGLNNQRKAQAERVVGKEIDWFDGQCGDALNEWDLE